MKIKLKKYEKQAIKDVAETLIDLVHENFCAVAGDCDDRITHRLVDPVDDKEQFFVEVFETEVYRHISERFKNY